MFIDDNKKIHKDIEFIIDIITLFFEIMFASCFVNHLSVEVCISYVYIPHISMNKIKLSFMVQKQCVVGSSRTLFASLHIRFFSFLSFHT